MTKLNLSIPHASPAAAGCRGEKSEQEGFDDSDAPAVRGFPLPVGNADGVGEMTNICISARRGDSIAAAERLTAALEQAFGPGRVSCSGDEGSASEVDGETLERRLRSADALLAVIGPDWLAADADGGRRLDAAEDGVARVLSQALASGKPVWPVLVDGAAMPAAAELPAALHGLARRPPLVLDDHGWDDDVAHLVDVLRPRPLPPTVRQTAAWELTAAAGVLIGTLLIADAWIVREVGLQQLAQAAIATLEAAAEPAAGAPGQVGPAGPLSGRIGESLALAAADAALPHLVDDGGWPAVGQLQFVSRSELAAAKEPVAPARQPAVRQKAQAVYLAEKKGGTAGGDLPLSFVAWQNKP